MVCSRHTMREIFVSIPNSLRFSFGTFLRALPWNGLQGVLDMSSFFSAFIASGKPV